MQVVINISLERYMQIISGKGHGCADDILQMFRDGVVLPAHGNLIDGDRMLLALNNMDTSNICDKERFEINFSKLMIKSTPIVLEQNYEV